MYKAYIILAHKNIQQLNRLLQRLNDGSSWFYIHIDLKLPKSELRDLVIIPDKTHLVKRLDAKWADFSIVDATLNAMQTIRAANINFQTITLLSGQDYPIKTNEQIDRLLKNSEQRILLEYYELPNFEKWSTRGGMYRIDKYFFGLKEYQLFGSRVVNFLGNIFTALKRKQLEGMLPYAGSQWWMIDMYALNYILDYVKANPGYVDFHKATFAPDEIFFHMILLNSKDPQICSGIVNNNKRYIHWKTGTNSHPELLKKEDLPGIMNSDSLFARKLDLKEYPEIFDLIDNLCLNKQTALA